ncbi:hypothetical protein HS7_19560 [Sulfolobales archaeon HS-7]|nr:hypothetical protein HS7_19560 [Sulfolobales archaeon HS-7]
MSQLDFLRHIVTRVLKPSALDQKKIDEARKLLSKAESKYKFSSFGGNPKNLIEYLNSPDFIELVLVIGTDTATKLLDAIEESYSDPEIVSTARKLKEELKGFDEYNETMGNSRILIQ